MRGRGSDGKKEKRKSFFSFFFFCYLPVRSICHCPPGVDSDRINGSTNSRSDKYFVLLLIVVVGGGVSEKGYWS